MLNGKEWHDGTTKKHLGKQACTTDADCYAGKCDVDSTVKGDDFFGNEVPKSEREGKAFMCKLIRSYSIVE